MFKSEPMDKSRGIFLCYYVDRHVNANTQIQLPWWVEPMVYFKSQHITEQKMLFMMVGEG